MNEKELEQKGKEAFTIHKNIVDRELLRRKLFIDNVSDLVKMHKMKLYKLQLGSEDAEWSSYLSQVELYYSRGEIEKWRRIFSVFVEGFNILPDTFVDIPSTRLEDIASFATDRDFVNECFDSARVLIPQHWKDFVSKNKGKPTSDSHKHNFSVFRICQGCGYKHKQDIGKMTDE